MNLLPVTSSHILNTTPTHGPQGTETAPRLFLSQKSQHQLKKCPPQKNVNFHFISQSKKQVPRPFPKEAMKVKAVQIQTQKQKHGQPVHIL